MNTRENTRRMEEENVNERVPPQGPQGDRVPQGNQVPVDPSAISNEEIRDEMSRFVTGVSDLVEEEYRTAMLHDDMNISRLIVYAQSIEESKLKRNNRELKRSRSNEQGQPRHYGKFLVDTNGCYGCGKNDHQVKDCPTLAAKEREAKQASPSILDPNALRKNRFYVLQANKDKGAHPDEGTGMW
ncbi:uncharacterized protein LOC125833329 [Solanum verrucosum]|uniref:uncharacterized protein LOC125833329 n=1 Tax=Solanum verrucosum TaxID=315347 RepID=UPI0020D14055|nr:uncharacterized protein LOC125833329 [Solanum verrucosum]